MVYFLRYIDLELPVYHVGHFRTTVTLLQMICKSCSALLLTDAQKTNFHRSLKRPNMTYLQKKSLRKTIYDACRKVKTCVVCGHHNGMVCLRDNDIYIHILGHSLIIGWRKKFTLKGHPPFWSIFVCMSANYRAYILT